MVFTSKGAERLAGFLIEIYIVLHGPFFCWSVYVCEGCGVYLDMHIWTLKVYFFPLGKIWGHVVAIFLYMSFWCVSSRLFASDSFYLTSGLVSIAMYIKFHLADVFIQSDLHMDSHTDGTATGAIWGSVACSRTLRHVDSRINPPTFRSLDDCSTAWAYLQTTYHSCPI